MVPFESSSTVFYSHFIATLALFRIICNIKRDIASQFFSYTLHLTPPLGGPRQNIAITYGTEKLECCMATEGEKV